jgi:hypothetical protein
MPTAAQDLSALVQAAATAFGEATGIPAHARKAPAGSGADAALEFHVGARRFKRPAHV